MNDELIAAMGDRANRDSANLMDLVIAGTIDVLAGSGTVRLQPARIEEIVSRIAPRRRDPDGAWVITLEPDAGSTIKVNAQDVLDFVRSKSVPDHVLPHFMACASEPGATLSDMFSQGYPGFASWATARQFKS